MAIQTISSFIDYYQKVSARTARLVALLPPDALEWAPAPGRFSAGDLVRHIAFLERYFYAETAAGRKNRYPGCHAALAEGYANLVATYHRLHGETVEVLRSLSDSALQGKCLTPMGGEITVWKWLRAMIEHQVHHRGQLYTYLGILGVATPPIFGLTAEEVVAHGDPFAQSG
jgi:uncharacterized damage-inducible protein DinB